MWSVSSAADEKYKHKCRQKYLQMPENIWLCSVSPVTSLQAPVTPLQQRPAVLQRKIYLHLRWLVPSGSRCSTASSYALQSAYKYLVLVIHDADTETDWHSPCRGFQLATSNWLLWLFMKHVEIKSSTTIKIVKITQSLDFIGWNNIYLSVIYSTSLCLIVSRFGRNSGRLNLMNWLCHQLQIRIEMFLFWTRK